MLGSELVSAVLAALGQLLLFTAVPFIWWLGRGRKSEPFAAWIGLKLPKIDRKSLFFACFILGFLLLTALGLAVVKLLVDPANLAMNQFSAGGIGTLFVVIVYSFVQTGLAEEILFRGFIGKRANETWGFTSGNLLQAALFGVLHGVLLFPVVGMWVAAVVTIFTALVGWLGGYLNEKLAGGSIFPSWLGHGCANLTVSLALIWGLI